MKSLYYFDLTKGNPIGARIILDAFGWGQGSSLIARLKWRQLFRDPFHAINAHQKPTPQERLSQHQMAPVVILYDLLREDGLGEEEALQFLLRLTKEVAVAFLAFNVPQIRRAEWAPQSMARKLASLQGIAQKFFNVESVNKVVEGDVFTLDVTRCHFAEYCRALNVPELGPLFCAADRYFFEHHQPDVQFERHQTLAKDGLPCDFRFTWKDQED